MSEKQKKRDILLVVLVLAAACLFYAGNRLFFSKPAMKVEISVDGKVIQTLDLKKDIQETIHGHNGGTNHLVIKGGQAWIDQATCPDKVCIRQGKIPQNGRMIVCLPNRVVIKIVGGDED